MASGWRAAESRARDVAAAAAVGQAGVLLVRRHGYRTREHDADPGSHTTNWLPGPPRRSEAWPTPQDAIELEIGAGDALFFDRRIWHQRSENYSTITRQAAFFGYTLRWIAPRDVVTEQDRSAPWWAELNPVQRQLLGGSGAESGDHRWGHYPQDTALYSVLRDAGLLDASYPPLIPDAADA